jgi:ribosomal protein S18 acetylase RimI-like enzyme
MTLRVLEAGDPTLAAASAVQHVGFGAAGTAAGPQGVTERDAATDDTGLDFLRERMRRGLTVTIVAEGEYGPAAAGQHQPVEGVTEIVGVATLPAVRRQGLAGAVTGALVEDALERGVETVFLSAGSDDITRVYSRLGFRRVGTACIVG